MSSLKAWVQKPSGLIKDEVGKAQALKVMLEKCLMKAESELQDQKFITNLKCYKILFNFEVIKFGIIT